MNTNIINATIINNDDNLNISYIFDIDKDEMVCLLDGEYECDIEFIDDSIQTTNGRGTLEVASEIFFLLSLYKPNLVVLSNSLLFPKKP